MAKEGSEKALTAKECLGWGWAVVCVGLTATGCTGDQDRLAERRQARPANTWDTVGQLLL